MASAVRWAALPDVGDQPRGHHGDALSPAALPGAGQQRAGQQVTSKDRPAGADSSVNGARLQPERKQPPVWRGSPDRPGGLGPRLNRAFGAVGELVG
jgi:hypothetical protein